MSERIKLEAWLIACLARQTSPPSLLPYTSCKDSTQTEFDGAAVRLFLARVDANVADVHQLCLEHSRVHEAPLHSALAHDHGIFHIVTLPAEHMHKGTGTIQLSLKQNKPQPEPSDGHREADTHTPTLTHADTQKR